MQTHTISPFGEYKLADEQISKIVANATEKLFWKIYHAAKDRNPKVLEEIKNNCLNQDNSYVAIYWNGDTPASLLAYEGDNEALEFLSKEVPSRHVFQVMVNGMAHNLIGIDNEVSFGVHKKTETLESIQTAPYLHQYPFVNLMAEHLANKCIQSPDYVLTNHFSDVFCAYAYARLGRVSEAMKVVDGIKKMNSHYTKTYLSNIAYLFARHGHSDAAAAFLDEYRTTVLRGYLEGGYLNQFARCLNNLSVMQVLPFTYDLVVSPINARNILHTSILWPLLSLLRPVSGIKKLYKGILGLPVQQLLDPNPVLNLNKPLPFINIVEKTAYWSSTYHLDFEQILAVFQPGVLTWLLEGLKSPYLNNYSIDVLAKILSFLPEPELSHERAMDLFVKVYFLLNRTFLITDLDQYVSGFKWDRYHTQRAMSLKNACMEVNTFTELGKLVVQQFGLFSGKVKGNINSKYKHEQPLSDAREDEYVRIMYKHKNRLGWR